MDTPYPFEPLLIFGFLSIMLLLGVIARATIRFFQKFLFPSCIIGGILGLILISARVVVFPASQLESFAYHLFNISFISIGLTSGVGVRRDAPREKDYVRGPLWMALLQGSTFSVQLMVGGLLTLLLGFIGIGLFRTFGFLVALGFTEGPGQALSIGIVPAQRKGEPAGELTTHTGNIESAAFQAALVGLVYVITYFFVRALGRFLAPENAKVLWGFFFLFGLGVALIVRYLMRKTGVERLINPGVQKRITGWSIDFMIVATVTAIQIRIVYSFIVPIFLIVAVAGPLTLLMVLFFGRRLRFFKLERIAAIYGTVTGTTSTGLLLLRVVDPDFRTPVTIELAIMNVFSIPIIGLCTVLMNGPLWWSWSVGFTAFVFAGIAGACAGLIRLLRLWMEAPSSMEHIPE